MIEYIQAGDGTAHVSSADDGALFSTIVGTGSYVGKGLADGLTLSIKDNNHLVLGTGTGWHNGRGFRVLSNEEVMIQSGTQSQRRADLIVARYTVEGSMERGSIAVIKGEPVAAGQQPKYPAHQTGNILNGVAVSDFPLYGVKLNGLQIESTEKLFTTVPSLTDLLGLINAANTAIDELKKRASSIEVVDGEQDEAIDALEKKNASQDTAINGKAPTAHASSATTYGVGNGSNYGHLKLQDTADANKGVGNGVAATPKAVATRAPTAHASTGTGYGVGSGSNYGHVKLSDSTTSTSAASGGIAATPAAVKKVWDSVSRSGEKILVTNQWGTVRASAFGSIVVVNVNWTSASGEWNNEQIATLPDNMRPATSINAPLFRNNDSNLGSISIAADPNGAIRIINHAGAQRQGDYIAGCLCFIAKWLSVSRTNSKPRDGLHVTTAGGLTCISFYGWVGLINGWGNMKLASGLPRPSFERGAAAVAQNSPSSCMCAHVDTSGNLYLSNKSDTATNSDAWAFFTLVYAAA